jgi:hypothetical protein
MVLLLNDFCRGFLSFAMFCRKITTSRWMFGVSKVLLSLRKGGLKARLSYFTYTSYKLSLGEGIKLFQGRGEEWRSVHNVAKSQEGAADVM